MSEIIEKVCRNFAKRSREIISANEQLISQYICQVEELKQKEVSVVEASKEQIVKLEQEIRILMEKNRGNLENSYADGLNVLRQLKEGY